MGTFDRITQDPKVMGGKACIRGMRVTAGMIVGQIGAGRSTDEILTDYPYLEREDIMQALRYAACGRKNERWIWPAHEAAGGHELVPAPGERAGRQPVLGRREPVTRLYGTLNA